MSYIIITNLGKNRIIYFIKFSFSIFSLIYLSYSLSLLSWTILCSCQKKIIIFIFKISSDFEKFSSVYKTYFGHDNFFAIFTSFTFFLIFSDDFNDFFWLLNLSIHSFCPPDLLTKTEADLWLLFVLVVNCFTTWSLCHLINFYIEMTIPKFSLWLEFPIETSEVQILITKFMPLCKWMFKHLFWVLFLI